MQVRLLRPVQFRLVGTILEVPDGVGELWISQRKVERVEPVEDPPERNKQGGAKRMVPPQHVDVSVRPNKGRRPLVA